MEKKIFIGKGGVGKSTISAACAIYESRKGVSTSNNTLIVDYDGGHSLTSAVADHIKVEQRLGGAFNYNKPAVALPLKEYEPNRIHCMELDNQNLNIAIIEDYNFTPFSEFRKPQNQNRNLIEYFAQFSGDYGIIPYCDIMKSLNPWIGNSGMGKFSSLIKIYNDAKDKKISNLIIDVEPTAGIERLLDYSQAVGEGVSKLVDTNLGTMRLLSSRFPDIRMFLENSEYIKNIHHYTQRLIDTVQALKSAQYFIVTTPQRSPVDQAYKIEDIINLHGGQVYGFVVNNIEGQVYESQQISRIKRKAGTRPVIEVYKDNKLCDIIGQDVRLRRSALNDVGKKFSDAIRQKKPFALNSQ
ncbi:MAG TPA: ArsA-related P-loop ATPase [Alphaproteobacteria bacterium]|nr:ArsA-related P-loop ATPase [Alphaproteobacteria bacterium]